MDQELPQYKYLTLGTKLDRQMLLSKLNNVCVMLCCINPTTVASSVVFCLTC